MFLTTREWIILWVVTLFIDGHQMLSPSQKFLKSVAEGFEEFLSTLPVEDQSSRRTEANPVDANGVDRNLTDGNGTDGNGADGYTADPELKLNSIPFAVNAVDAESLTGETDGEADFPLNDPCVTQSTTRRVDQAGNDQQVSYYRVKFENGQRNQVIHMPFWPHFAKAPQVAVNVLSGEGATCRITANEAFGARIEVNLRSSVDLPCDCMVEIITTSSESNPANTSH